METTENGSDMIDPDRNYFDNVIPDVNCKYYSLTEFTSLGFDNNVFSLLNYNIRSFHANGPVFQSMLNSLEHDFKCVVLSETWNTENNLELCKMDQFNGFHTFRQNSRGGGISVFCDQTISASKCENVSRCTDDLESCAVKFNYNSLSFLILAIYRPPSGNIQNFTLELESILDVINLHTNTVIITGDFNLNLTALENTNVLNFSSALHSLHFISVINKPTRFPTCNSDSTPTTLDHIWLNSTNCSCSGLLYFDATDHLPCFCCIDVPFFHSSDTKVKIQLRPFTEENFLNFTNKLIDTNWDELLNYNDVDSCLNKFIEHLNKLYQENFPLKTKYLSKKRLRNNWITADIKRLINLKSEYLKQFRNGFISRETNNRLKNRLGKMIKSAKKQFYVNAFNNFKNNAKRSWELLHQISGTNKTRQETIQLLDGNCVLTEKSDIANKFGDFFNSIGRELDSNLTVNNVSPYNLIERNPRTFYIFPVTETECEKIISKLKLTKTHIDFLPVKIFISIKSHILNPLCKILMASFESGIFPQQLKIARITPIFKKGDKNNPSNYRPISSLPYISKIFERCMTNRLTSFFSKFSLFSKSQFGFLKNRSTQDALFDLTETIYDSLNFKKHHISVMIDLKKAFDTVNHDILLDKLELYGIRGLGLSWLKSYLTNRTNYVGLGQTNSSRHVINIGVPQGSIIGPILFLIYINDLPKISNNMTSTLFADDTNFSMSHTDYDTMVNILNSDLTTIQDWTIANRLTINLSKTEMLLFTNRLTNRNDQQIMLGGGCVGFVESCKFLGIYIDEGLTFKTHINYVLGKISRSAGILYRIKNLLPLESRLKYYFSFIYPYISYNISIWGGTNLCNLYPLNIQHKRIIRLLSDAGYLDHTAPLFKKLKLLKLDDIYKLHILTHTYRAIKSGNYQTNHNLNTRYRHLATPTFQRLSRTQQSISFCGPVLWNSLPDTIKEIGTASLFKRHLKSYMISQYE